MATKRSQCVGYIMNSRPISLRVFEDGIVGVFSDSDEVLLWSTCLSSKIRRTIFGLNETEVKYLDKFRG